MVVRDRERAKAKASENAREFVQEEDTYGFISL